MKYRIIENGLGKFKVQKKVNWSNLWNDVYLEGCDYPDITEKYKESKHYNDYENQVFGDLDLATKKLDRLIAEEKKKKLEDTFKVIIKQSV